MKMQKKFPPYQQVGGARTQAGHGDLERGVALDVWCLKLCGETRLLRPLPRDYAAQGPVVDVHHAVPGYGGGVNVQAHELGPFLGRELVGLGLGDAELLEAAEHNGREPALAVMCCAHALKELLVRLACLVQHARIKRCGAQVVCRRDGVDVACQVEVELLHGDHLGVSPAGSAALDAKRRALAWSAVGTPSLFCPFLPKCVEGPRQLHVLRTE